jgi:hypothetical protein
MPLGTVFPLCCLSRFQGLQWRYSNSPQHGQLTSYANLARTEHKTPLSIVPHCLAMDLVSLHVRQTLPTKSCFAGSLILAVRPYVTVRKRKFHAYMIVDRPPSVLEQLTLRLRDGQFFSWKELYVVHRSNWLLRICWWFLHSSSLVHVNSTLIYFKKQEF